MKGTTLAGGFRWALAVLVLSSCRVDSLLKSGQASTHPPDDPAALAQYRSNGTTPIAAGETIDEASVMLAAAVTDPEVSDTLRLQVEVRPVSSSFSGEATHTGAGVTSGATATVSVGGLDPNTAYHWQARTIDRGNRTSAWVAYATANGQSFRVAIPRGPLVPTSAAQLRVDGSTTIALGAPTAETTVILAATLSDPDDDAEIRLEVEVRPVAEPFTGTATGSSAAVSSGGRGTVAITVADNIAYHWQYRANDGTGRFSAWQSFGGNAEASADFSVAVEDLPGTPSASAQFRSDGVTPIAVGGATPEASVILAATPADPDPADVLRLQVEFRPITDAFTGVPTHTSIGVPNGTRASVQVGVTDNVAYHWQLRSIDQGDRAGPWAEFGGNAQGTADVIVSVPDDPAIPGSAGQYMQNGTTAIAVGGTTSQTAVVLKATLSDPDVGASLRYEVELRVVGQPFTGTATHASAAVASGGEASITASVADGSSYRWQYRTIDETSRVSAWTDFGGNGGGPDFSVATVVTPPNNPPATPAALAQFAEDGTTPVATGGSVTDSNVVVAASVSDPENDAVRIEVEVRPSSVAFNGAATHTASGVASGTTGKVTLARLAAGGYHWQVRACDASQCSAWVSYGGNAESADDFVRTP